MRLRERASEREGGGRSVYVHMIQYGAYCCDYMNELISMHVCGCVGVQLGGRCYYWHGHVSCACNWLAWLLFGGVRSDYIILKKTCLVIIIYTYLCKCHVVVLRVTL